MLSFADVQSIYRNEKNSPSLQIIPPDFYAQVVSLSESLEEEHKGHILKLLEEIVIRRRNKIVLHALRASDKSDPPSNINPSEVTFFNQASKLMVEYKKTILDVKPAVTIEENHEEEAVDVGGEMVRLRFLKPIPEIVGADSKMYGPFKEDDVGEIPADNAEILLKNGVAEKTENL